ncbi:formate/nitrite transporter family protein [Cellulomonas sp. C5510]|uniref:formate/nitrite transporter family protein n=1 Tax=Cellulomonas sp. C5510 TaxID=2871170 RepID=UPI001C970680|nr:formate/nitrite transporter family protein [Cellulomonas sp. C5510]QZN84188.1 formate/nitrite transporter family protein [Cellulomonas sp. C5510]
MERADDERTSPDERDDDAGTTEEKDEALDRVVLEGRPRLYRSTPDLLATGTVAGVEVGVGVLALLVVVHETGSMLLGALAFSIGLVALRLGHSELFTEGFHVPVMVVVAGEARWIHLARLWAGTLLGNLAGGWVLAWLVAVALPDLHGTAGRLSREFTDHDLDLRGFALAALAGAAITLLTRMQNGTDDDVAKVVAAVGIAFVIVGTGLLHSVLDTLVIFVAVHAGEPGASMASWLGWFWWVVLSNLVGGLLLTTMLRIVRSRERLAQWRRADT